MLHTSLLQEIVRRLPLRLESDHFFLHYGLRNPEYGPGLGGHGVTSSELVYRYCDALEDLYRLMTESPFNRQPPLVGASGKTAIYVFDTSSILQGDGAFTDADINGYPFIALASRHREPTAEAALKRAEAEATHEGTHVFNYRQRPFRDLYSWPWVWFDEAIAIFVESTVQLGQPDCLRFLASWIDMPELSLDHLAAKYQAGMFARYLEKRMGSGFINTVWTDSLPGETALGALARLLRARGPEFAASDPHVPDVFASGYCMDSYFLWDPSSAGFSPDVHDRYGERAVTRSWQIEAGEPASCQGTLDHLACRYYRCYLQGNVTALQVRLETEPGSNLTPLKAEVAEVTKARKRGFVRPLSRLIPSSSGGQAVLSTMLTGLEPEKIDHLVLVVSNCGLRADATGYSIAHDDGQEYTLEISTP